MKTILLSLALCALTSTTAIAGPAGDCLTTKMAEVYREVGFAPSPEADRALIEMAATADNILRVHARDHAGFTYITDSLIADAEKYAALADTYPEGSPDWVSNMLTSMTQYVESNCLSTEWIKLQGNG
jgi:hypothetical protein